MRFMRGDVRDHVASQQNDHGASYRGCEASQSWSRSKIEFCEIFEVVRSSTFSTVSTHQRRRCGVIVQRERRRMQEARRPAFRLLPVGHRIHFHRFKFGKIEPEMLCNESA